MKLSDSEGNVLIEESVPCGFSAVTLSNADLKQGGTYTVEIGETQEEITLSEIAATYGSSTGGFGANMGGGRMGMHGNRETADDPDAEENTDEPAQGTINPAGTADTSSSEEDNNEMQPPQGMMNPAGTADTSSSEADNNEMQPPQEAAGMPDMGTGTPAAGMSPDNRGQGHGMQGMQQFGGQEQVSETSETGTGKALSAYGDDTRVLLAASCVVMLAGLVFAGLFRRRGV